MNWLKKVNVLMSNVTEIVRILKNLKSLPEL